MRRIVPLAAALSAAALVAAGCGSSDGGSSSTGAGASSGSAAGASGSSGAAAPGYGGAMTTPPAKAPASGGGAATVKTASTPLGTILVDRSGRSLYLFERDTGPRSTCAGECAVDWPPLTTSGRPRAAGKAAAGMLGTTRRADGTTEVTYAGHPLYYYVGDSGPGQTNGQNIDAFGAEWYVLGPGGAAITGHGS